VKVGAVKLIVGRAVQSFMLIGERELADDLAGIVQSKDVSGGPDRQLGKGLAKAEAVSTCIALALSWMPAPISLSSGACS
jgi:hypothetical protein